MSLMDLPTGLLPVSKAHTKPILVSVFVTKSFFCIVLHCTTVPKESLGYDVCSEFAVQFDRMYEGRDVNKYPLGNPMLINLAEPVHDLTNTNTILNRVQFPVRYNFPQDSQTGVVTREFESQDSQNQYFYLANPDTGMVLSAVEGTDEVEAQVRGSNNADCQLWKLSTLDNYRGGYIENKCNDKFLTNSYDGRRNRCRLVI